MKILKKYFFNKINIFREIVRRCKIYYQYLVEIIEKIKKKI